MCRSFAILIAGSLAIGSSVAPLRAADNPTTRPMLDELNRETTALYRQAQAGLYHVQLPQPRWVNAYAMAAVKRWDKQLDPELRRRLEQDAGNPIQAAEVAPLPTTRPVSFGDATSVPGEGTYIVVRPGTVMADVRDPVLGGRLQAEPTTRPAASGFAPNRVGLLIDAGGHVLVPLYVEREALGPEPTVKLAGPDGVLTTARFVGSDRQTNLTLLQVEKAAGQPVRLGESRPDSGALVMCVAPTDGAGKLSVWSDGAQENGIILTTDGQVAGVARFGQFLTGGACRLIARQLIEYGAVRRATLGVLITEVRRGNEGFRAAAGQAVPASRAAMRIDQVIANSAADKAGLRAGDLVLAVGGEPVADLPSFAAAIAARNGPTELRVLRGEAVLRISVNLEQQK
jgi:S1-C subfamily serine protease